MSPPCKSIFQEFVGLSLGGCRVLEGGILCCAMFGISPTLVLLVFIPTNYTLLVVAKYMQPHKFVTSLNNNDHIVIRL